MKDIPKKIYLQIGLEDDYDNVESFNEFSQVSWCTDKIHSSDIEYVLSPDPDKSAFLDEITKLAERVIYWQNRCEAAEENIKTHSEWVKSIGRATRFKKFKKWDAAYKHWEQLKNQKP